MLKSRLVMFINRLSIRSNSRVVSQRPIGSCLSDSASKLFVNYLDQRTVLDHPRVALDHTPLHYVGEPCLQLCAAAAVLTPVIFVCDRLTSECRPMLRAVKRAI